MAPAAKKRASSAKRSSSARKASAKQTGASEAIDPGTAYGEPVRVGLATGSRAENTLPETKAPSRDTQTVTPVAVGPDSQGGGPYNE